MSARSPNKAKAPQTAAERGYVLHPVPSRQVSALGRAALEEWRARFTGPEHFEFQHQGQSFRVEPALMASVDLHRLNLAKKNIDGQWTPYAPVEVLEYRFPSSVIPASLADVRRGLNESVALADPVDPGAQFLVMSPLEWPAQQAGDDA